MTHNYLSWLSKNDLDFFKESKFGSFMFLKIQSLIDSKIISRDIGERSIYQLVSNYNSYFNNPKNVWKQVGLFMDSFPEVFDISDILALDYRVRKFIVPLNHKITNQAKDIFGSKGVRYICFERVFDNNNIDFFIIIEDLIQKVWYHQTFGEAFHLLTSSGFSPGLYYYTNDERVGSVYHVFGYSSDITSGNGGLRKDLNAAFRSSWESNFARILNHLGLQWEYEANDKFEIEINSQKTYYHPDFKVTMPNNIFWWYEIKGFWDNTSLQKIASFNKNYPKNRLNLIDSDIFYSLQEKFSHFITGWETINIVNYSSEKVKVVGIKFGNRLNSIEKLLDHEKLILERESQNQFDQKAIKVLSVNKNELGYICKEWASIYSFKMDLGMKYTACLDSKHLDEGHIIIKIERVGEIPNDLIDNLFNR